MEREGKEKKRPEIGPDARSSKVEGKEARESESTTGRTRARLMSELERKVEEDTM